MAFVPENPPSDESPPLIRYLRAQFQAIERALNTLAVDTLRLFVAKGYGGVVNAASAPGADIGLAFQVITVMDTGVISEPVDVTQDLAGSAITIDRAGVWNINVQVTFEHDEINAGRETHIQLYDNTGGAVLLENTLFTGRNTAGSFWSGTELVDFPEALVGSSMVLRIGGGDDYAFVNYVGASLSASSASEIQDLGP